MIALGKRQDVRRTFEDTFVRELRLRGTDAVAGYTLLPSTTDSVDRAALGKAVAESGADAVIITRLAKLEQRVISAPSTYSPPSTSLYGYHSTSWSNYYEPSGVSGGSLQPYQTTIATLETSLFDVQTQRAVWSATTETFDADAAQQQIPHLVKALINRMANAKLIE